MEAVILAEKLFFTQKIFLRVFENILKRSEKDFWELFFKFISLPVTEPFEFKIKFIFNSKIIFRSRVKKDFWELFFEYF